MAKHAFWWFQSVFQGITGEEARQIGILDTLLVVNNELLWFSKPFNGKIVKHDEENLVAFLNHATSNATSVGVYTAAGGCSILKYNLEGEQALRWSRVEDLPEGTVCLQRRLDSECDRYRYRFSRTRGGITLCKVKSYPPVGDIVETLRDPAMQKTCDGIVQLLVSAVESFRGVTILSACFDLVVDAEGQMWLTHALNIVTDSLDDVSCAGDYCNYKLDDGELVELSDDVVPVPVTTIPNKSVLLSRFAHAMQFDKTGVPHSRGDFRGINSTDFHTEVGVCARCADIYESMDRQRAEDLREVEGKRRQARKENRKAADEQKIRTLSRKERLAVSPLSNPYAPVEPNAAPPVPISVSEQRQRDAQRAQPRKVPGRAKVRSRKSTGPRPASTKESRKEQGAASSRAGSPSVEHAMLRNMNRSSKKSPYAGALPMSKKSRRPRATPLV